MKTLVLASMATLCAAVAPAQDASRGVVKLTAHTLCSRRFDSGICIDTPCLHVVTAYHVVALLGAGLKVEGVAVASAQSATGPQDSEAVDMNVAGSVFRFNPSRDVALLTLQRPLPPRFMGLSFASYKPSIGQRVTRIARHVDAYDIASGRVVGDDLRYQAPEHLVDLEDQFLLDCSSRPGNSGGAVIDGDGRVLGLVEIRSTESSGRIGTAVLPASIVSGFLRGKDPALWARLFDKPAANAAAAQRHDIDWPVALDRQPIPANGTHDPNLPIGALRTQVATGLAAMQRMFAQQSMRFWGDGEREQSWQYQVSMYSDGQRFRTVAGKETDAAALPGPKAGILPESEWYDVLSLIETAKLEYMGASSHSGEPVHVFRFNNTAEDAVCWFRQRTAVVFGHKDEAQYVVCGGIVVSDEHFNVLGISQRLAPQFGFVAEWQALARYGLVKLPDGHEPYLVPLSMDLSARFKNGKVYHASERWSDYHLLVAESTLRTE